MVHGAVVDAGWALGERSGPARGEGGAIGRQERRDRRMAAADVTHRRAAVLGLERVVSGHVLVVVVGTLVGEVPIVDQVLHVLDELHPAWRQGDAEHEEEQLAEEDAHEVFYPARRVGG